MISPTKIILKELQSIKMYVHDFPIFFATKFATKLGTKITAISSIAILGKSNTIMNIKTVLKTPLLKIYGNTNIKKGLSVISIPFLRIFGFVNTKAKVDIETLPMLKLFSKDNVTSNSVAVSAKAKSLIFFKNYERNDLVIKDVFADSKISQISNFLYDEIS